MPTCRKFFEITGLEFVGNELFSKNLSLWNRSSFTNRQKMFFYKFYNNTLGINVRTSHFVANGTRLCFFCSRVGIQAGNDETFIHLFFSCPTVRRWQENFFNHCFPELPAMTEYNKKSIWMLGYNENLFSLVVMTATLSFQFCIWEAKLKKTIPSFHTLYQHFYDNFRQTYNFNSDVRMSCTKINVTLCRSLLGERQVVHDGGA